jgi:translation initiation factor eIF-2B subunit delta
MYSPQTSARSSLDGGPGIQVQGMNNAVARIKEEDALPLTPVETRSVLLDEGDLQEDLNTAEEFKQGEQKMMELLKSEEIESSEDARSTQTTLKNDEKSTSSGDKPCRPNVDIPPKKQMTKAERRALQEAQRAAKAAANSQAQSTKKQPKKEAEPVHATLPGAAPKREPSSRKTFGATQPTAFFDHLPRQEKMSMEEIAITASEKSIPVSCVSLGLQMLDGSLRGTNRRSLALLQMIDEVISSFDLSEGQSFTREFTQAVKNMVSFLVRCRPLSPAVGNVVKSIKAELGHLATQTGLSNEDAKSELRHFVATFAQDKISVAQQALATIASEKINNGDIILTYARSSTVERTLKAAVSDGKKFTVVIADSSPLFEGKELLIELLRSGIPCEYMLLNSLETGMNLANKVMLGAAAVMSNGAVLSRAGTAAVAMSASLAHVPVIICSETYKFHERVQLDSITNNELADPANLLRHDGIPLEIKDAVLRSDNHSPSSLSMLNIVYDTTPADYISVVITEVGALPPTSVPVVLREYRSETELMMQASAN